MSKRAFPPELRTASVISRWSIVWTLTKDTVSNHSYFVTFYSREIAKLIGWKGDMGNLMFRALTHDLDELVTGDLVSPVKKEIIDDKRAEEYISMKMEERLPVVVHDLDEMDVNEQETDEAFLIIKAADRLDALIFLIVERRLGNAVISPRIPSVWANLEAAWRALPAPKDELDKLWNTVILPAIHEHETTGGFGI